MRARLSEATAVIPGLEARAKARRGPRPAALLPSRPPARRKHPLSSSLTPPSTGPNRPPACPSAAAPQDADALRAELSSAKAECAALRETRSRLTAQLDVLAVRRRGPCLSGACRRSRLLTPHRSPPREQTEKAGDADRRAAAAAAECTQLAAELASAREAAAAAERRTEGLASAAGQLAAAQEQAAAAREEVELLRRDLERARAEAGRKDQAGAEMQKTIREKEARARLGSREGIVGHSREGCGAAFAVRGRVP